MCLFLVRKVCSEVVQGKRDTKGRKAPRSRLSIDPGPRDNFFLYPPPLEYCQISSQTALWETEYAELDALFRHKWDHLF